MTSKAVKIALPVVVAGGVAGYLGYPAYANDQFESRVVDVFEDRGFSVRHSGLSYDHSKGFGTLVVEDYAMVRNGSTLKFNDVRVEDHTAYFESGEFGAGEDQSIAFGEGEVLYEPQSRLIVDLDSVSAQTQEVNPWAEYMGAEVADPEVRFSLQPTTNGQQASMRVASEGFGALSTSLSITSADLWSLAEDTTVSALVQTAEIVAADITFENQGGVEDMMAAAAKEEGVSREELKAMLAVGFGGSQIPDEVKMAVVEFVEDPGTLSIQLSPKTKTAGKSEVSMTLPDMVMGFQMVQTGKLQASEYLDSLGFQVVSTPK